MSDGSVSGESGTYLICFDFPDDDSPRFAADTGWMSKTLKSAARFETWVEADRYLKTNYVASREFGVVVEIAPVRETA